MANYPSLTQTLESDEAFVDDLSIDRAVNGAAKGRAFFTAKKREFTVRHILTTAERATLDSFYDSNRTLTVAFTWSGNGSQYDVLFERPPQYKPFGGGLWAAEVRLIQK